ncbi:transcription factor RfeG [Diaporthe helianthi]|uniref:Transcription factor RfeG n=1 Tax=Diaporthe helianthi TaxID=158607 RepID=A0A2P5HPN5_DIAHE|nr:transcription factor RfeG [Diaporthe helianthi]
MSSRREHGSGTPSNASARQNEYFIPRDGIDREVITADICRYLGNDALVRPGTYEDKKSGRTIQGYFVTAYRNLTSAMIADLKADSARWEQERRNHSGGTLTSHDSSAFFLRSSKSNSPPARYSDSQNRFNSSTQYDTSGVIYPNGPSGDSYKSVPRYPGSDAPGYSASTGSQPYHQENRQSGYGGQYPQATFSPQVQDARAYPQQPVAGSSSVYGGQAYPNHPTNNVPDPVPYYSGGMSVVSPQSQHRPQAGYPDGRIDASSRSAYPPSSYGAQEQAYYTSQYPIPQPHDASFGRQAYGATNQAEILGTSSGQAPMYDSRQYEPQPQYDNQTPPPTRPVASSSSQAQTGHSGSSHSRRSDRERDRDDRRGRR